MEKYDIAIIGTGPAGISAAITAKLRNKNILLLGNGRFSDKIEKAQKIYNYPGFPEVSGPELGEAYASHLKAGVFRQRGELLCHLRCPFVQREESRYRGIFPQGRKGSGIYGGDGRGSIIFPYV